MEIYLSTGRRVSRRVAGGDDSLQDPAGALGQGVDSDLEEDSSQRDEERPAVPGKAGGLVPPDSESQLSPDGRAVGAFAAGDDYPLLPGLVSDAVHRLAPVHGIHFFDFQFLPGFAARVVSQDVAASITVSA